MPDAPVAPPPGEIVVVTERVVACDGGASVLGHPRVYLRIVHNEAVCPYCSRRFVLQDGGPSDGH